MKEFNIKGKTISTGDIYEMERCFSQNDFNDFAALSGDNNPIHVDPEFAAKTHFGATVAHGMLLYTGLKGFLQSLFPGSVQLSHQMMFPSGTTAGETVRYQVKIISLEPGKNTLTLKVQMIRPCGNLGLDGETLIKWEGLS